MRDVNKFKVNVKISLFVFIVMFVLLIVYLAYAVTTYGEKWFATPHNSRIQTGVMRSGDILDADGIKLAYNANDTRRYAASEDVRRGVAHVVGDKYGKSFGAETIFARYLYGFNKDVLERINGLIIGEDKKGSDIQLTIDSGLSAFIYEKMDNRKGSVVVLNYKTGEIVAEVNYPNFDPNTVKTDKLEEGSLVNRAISGRYPPGSTMKLVAAAAAIDNNVEISHTCKGTVQIDGQVVKCAHKTRHGKMNLEKAVKESCNTYFAKLAEKLGESTMNSYAEKFMFNTEFNFSDVSVSKGNFDAGDTDFNLAWSAIGQYKDLMTPMQGAMMVAAIANDGVVMEPKLLKAVLADKIKTFTMQPEQYKRVLSSATARELGDMLEVAVKSGTGTAAKVNGATVCGKTGTAEYKEKGKTKEHSWFVGYIKDASKPYCISVILEGAGSGSKYATPLAGEIFNKIVNN